jgi:transcriptional regulator with XRE-family HTH domain
MWKEMSNPAIIKELGNRLKELRLRKGIQQAELAKMSGVSLYTISKIEQGKATNITMIVSVLRALGVVENLELLVPKGLPSPVLLKKLNGKAQYRIRKKASDA